MSDSPADVRSYQEADVRSYQELVPLLNDTIKNLRAQINQPGISRDKAKLTGAYVRRIEEVRDLAILGREAPRQTAEELIELGPWVVGDRSTKTPHYDDMALLHFATGHPLDDVNRIMKEAAMGEDGRHSILSREQQFEALKMFEEKTWTEVARQFCNCGEDYHTPSCGDRVRQQVQPLSTLLKKYTR